MAIPKRVVLLTLLTGGILLIFAPGFAPMRARALATAPSQEIPFRRTPWTTVDLPGNGGLEGRVQALTSCQEKTFAAGFIEMGGNATWAVRETTIGDSTWTATDTGVPGYRRSAASGIAIGDGGLIVVAGVASNSKTSSTWIVRKYIRGSPSWKIIDRFNGDSNRAQAAAVSISDDGTIYVAGTRAPHFWVVRRSTDGGRNWKTVDELSASGGATAPQAVVAGKAGDVFVGGTVGGKWTVRHSYDGLIWNTVDALRSGAANAVARWHGQVVFAGWVGNKWIVREASFDAPSDWNTIDDYLPNQDPANQASAEGIAISEEGAVFVTGRMIGVPETLPLEQRNQYSLTRRSRLFAGGAMDFRESDALLSPLGACPVFLPGSGPLSSGVAIDSRGNVFTGKHWPGKPGPGECGWTVRELKHASL